MWISTVGDGAGKGPVTARQLLRLLALICGLAPLAVPGPAWADKGGYFRIATGTTDGTYFPIGALIASAISNPPGSRECDDGGSCGVPGLIAVGQASKGSVENVGLIATGAVESGLSQADVAYMAYFGLGRFRGGAPYDGLRVIATLYPELVQLAVRKYSGIYAVEDLRGKRVSLGAVGSGTALDAEVIMAAHGLKLNDYRAVHFDLGESADRLRLGKLDAFFIIAGTPVPAIEDLAEQANITLLPIQGPPSDRLRKKFPFFAAATLPAGVYRNVDEIETLSVGAQWLVSSRLDETQVYEMTRALWHPSTRRLLDHGHPMGRLIQLKSALDGLAIPLHEGAKRYYREIGVLP
jgi:TRAP transporter TAXI family solute receptor